DQLRDPRFLLLRSAAFDPLSSEPPALRIGAGQLETTSLTARAARLAARTQQAGESGSAYYIVQYADRILPARAESLRAEGHEVVGYLANNAYIIKAARSAASRLQAAQARGDFRWVGAYGAGLKVEPTLAQMADDVANGTAK